MPNVRKLIATLNQKFVDVLATSAFLHVAGLHITGLLEAMWGREDFTIVFQVVTKFKQDTFGMNHVLVIEILGRITAFLMLIWCQFLIVLRMVCQKHGAKTAVYCSCFEPLSFQGGVYATAGNFGGTKRCYP